MQKKRSRTLVITLALAGLAFDALALGFGNASPAATLGQSLDHVIGLRLDAGETLDPQCVAAEVIVGDQRLPATAVRTRIEGEGSRLSLRVATTVVIDEPVVTVAVSVGCPPRLSKRFVLFADPAPVVTASAPIIAIAPPVDSLPAAPEPRPEAPAAVTEARASTPAVAAAPMRVARASARPPTRKRAAPQRRTARAAQATAPVQAARPRLKLDVAEPPSVATPALTAEVIDAAASAAATLAAAQASAQATSAAAGRISALEKSIDALRADSAADREALRLLRQRAADGDSAARWMPWLAGLVALLAALAAWLGLKLRQLQAERDQAWWGAAAGATGVGAAGAAVAPEAAVQQAQRADTGHGVSTVAVGGPISAGYSTTRPGSLSPVFTADPAVMGPITEPPLTSVERTQPMPVGWRDDFEPQRAVSIEELIDLEQQAEFFIVLGQEDAAVDLLVDHLRHTGGGSPMPYLKLLEIYRRRGDREAYDRTRARFNHRFNAYAPDWEVDTHHGRLLEDYPSIVARLQMAWPSPIDAMAELESLLFRKTRGELFDMPAYRDVLFLYSLARDLLDREPVDAGRVDVLLPINEGDEFTQPMSLDEVPSTLHSGMVPLDNQPTVPVDLDVTQPQMPESMFGERTEPGVGSRRRRQP